MAEAELLRDTADDPLRVNADHDADVLGRAMLDFEGKDSGEVELKKGDQVEILGSTLSGQRFVLINRRTGLQGECPIDIIDIYDEELDALRRDTLDGGSKLRRRSPVVRKKRNTFYEGSRVRDYEDLIHSAPTVSASTKEAMGDLTAKSISVPIGSSQRSQSCELLSEIPPEYDLIEKHNIISVAGTDREGRPVIVFSACKLPPSHTINHQKLLDYLKFTVDQYVESDYTVLYLHYGLTSANKPSLAWLRQVYKDLDRKYKKNLKKLYIVHPTRLVKVLYLFLKPFLSYKFGKKLTYVNRLDDLSDALYLEQVDIPQEVKDYDIKQKFKVPQQKASSQFYTNDPANSQPLPHQQFGVTLEDLEKHTGQPIPTVVRACVEHLEKEGLDVEGIFRRSTTQTAMRTAKSDFNEGKFVVFDDPHLAAVILKQFFRELPEPLLTFETFEKLKGFKGRTTEDKIECCKQVVSQLKEPNKTVLHYLVEFLLKVHANSEVNKMTTNNLAIVFGPNILWSMDQAATLTSMGEVNTFTVTLIGHFDKIFSGQQLLHS